MTFMLHLFVFIHKFLDDDFNFHAKQIKTKIPTTTQGSNTGFVGQNPIRKGFFRTSYGKILCTQFSPKLLEFLLKVIFEKLEGFKVRRVRYLKRFN